MKKHHIVLASALMMAATGQAHAQGLTGYVGLNAGWNATNAEVNSVTDVNQGMLGGSTIITEKRDDSLSGAAYGLVGGIKMPISTGYVGIEVNISDASAESESNNIIDGTTVAASSTTSDLSFGVTGILATEIAPKTHLYGLLGYQMTKFETQYTDRDTATNDIASSTQDENFGGARVGAGIESAVTDSLSVRLEWSQTYYSEESLAFTTVTSSGPTTFDVKPTETRVTLGVIAHF